MCQFLEATLYTRLEHYLGLSELAKGKYELQETRSYLQYAYTADCCSPDCLYHAVCVREKNITPGVLL